MERIKQLFAKYREVILYLVFGGCTTLVNIIVYFIADKIGLGTTVSTVLAWFLSVLFAYVTNRQFVFQSKAHGVRGVLKEGVSFFTGRLATGVMDLMIMLLFVDGFDFNGMLIKILSNVIVIVANYYLSKFWIFNKKGDEPKKFRTVMVQILRLTPGLAVVLFSIYMFITMGINVRIDKGYDHYFSANWLKVANEELVIYSILLVVALVGIVWLFSKKKNDEKFALHIIWWGIGISAVAAIVLKQPAVLFACAFAVIFMLLKKSKVKSFSDKQFAELIVFCFVAIFALQYIVASCIWFEAGWDVWMCVENAKRIALAGRGNADIGYFSQYPNNFVLLYTLIAILKVGNIFFKEPYYAVLMVSVLSVGISLMLTTLSIFKITKNRTVTVIGMLLGTALIALSPWIVVPYTDSLGMIFPTLALFCFLYIRPVYARYFAVALCLFIGYLYKPTILILLIALCILGAIRLLAKVLEEKRFPVKRVAALALAVVLAFGSSVVFKNVITAGNEEQADENKAFGIAHYLMMGANTETDGVYSQDDVNYSASFPDTESRSEANIKETFSRIKEMGVRGYLKHLVRKNLMNYNNGTFSFGTEGNFYSDVPEAKSEFADFLRSFYYTSSSVGGTNAYYPYANTMQILWFAILICCCFCGFGKKSEAESWVSISLIGVSLFLLIFECRSRYLFLFTPLYLFLACIGMCKMVSLAQKGVAVYRVGKEKIVQMKNNLLNEEAPSEETTSLESVEDMKE